MITITKDEFFHCVMNVVVQLIPLLLVLNYFGSLVLLIVSSNTANTVEKYNAVSLYLAEVGISPALLISWYYRKHVIPRYRNYGAMLVFNRVFGAINACLCVICLLFLRVGLEEHLRFCIGTP